MSILETVSTLGTYFRYEQFETLGPEDAEFALTQVGRNFLAFERYERAYWAWTTGVLVDQRTEQPIIPVDKIDAIMLGLGVPLREPNERFRMYLTDKEKETFANKMADQLVVMRRRAIRALVDEADARMSPAQQEAYNRRQHAFNQQAAIFTMGIKKKDPFMFDRILELTDQKFGYTEYSWIEEINKLHDKWNVDPRGGGAETRSGY